MFSLEELSRVMKLEYPKNRIVNWDIEHYEEIELNDLDWSLIAQFKNHRQYMKAYSEFGDSYTAICDNVIYAMFGVFPLWEGVAEAWLLPSRHIRRKIVPFHRGSLAFFDFYARKNNIKRLQYTVHIANLHSLKWAKRCYFHNEGTLKFYGPDGKDHIMFARYY